VRESLAKCEEKPAVDGGSRPDETHPGRQARKERQGQRSKVQTARSPAKSLSRNINCSRLTGTTVDCSAFSPGRGSLKIVPLEGKIGTAMTDMFSLPKPFEQIFQDKKKAERTWVSLSSAHDARFSDSKKREVVEIHKPKASL